MQITLKNTEERGEFVRNNSTGLEACSRMMYELSAENTAVRDPNRWSFLTTRWKPQSILYESIPASCWQENTMWNVLKEGGAFGFKSVNILVASF